VGREDLKHAVLDPKDRDVERAAAEIVDADDAGVALVEAVGQRGRGRLVDDAEDVEAGDAPGVARGGPLRVVEVGRNGNHRPIYRPLCRPPRPPRSLPRPAASARAARTPKSPAA